MNLRRTVILAWAGLLFSATALSYGFVQAGAWQYSLGILALALLGMIAGRYQWRWVPPMIFTIALVAAVIGFWLDVWPGWPIFGLLGALAAADLLQFTGRMDSAMIVGGDVKRLEDRHLRRLGIVLSMGGVLYLIAWLVQVRITFGIALVLGLISVLGISMGLNTRRRANQ